MLLILIFRHEPLRPEVSKLSQSIIHTAGDWSTPSCMRIPRRRRLSPRQGYDKPQETDNKATCKQKNAKLMPYSKTYHGDS